MNKLLNFKCRYVSDAFFITEVVATQCVCVMLITLFRKVDVPEFKSRFIMA